MESDNVIESIRELIELFDFLDLRRFEQIIISEDVNEEVNLITKSNHKKDSSIYAKVITDTNDEHIDIILILNKNFSLTLNKKINEEITYRNSLHVFHHELAHIHDYNKKIDVFQEQMINTKYHGVEAITFPLAQVCWSEYIANFISSSSTTINSFPLLTAETLASLIISMAKEIRTKIMVYKSNKNRTDVFEDVKRQIEKTLKTAAYLLGYLHGLNITLVQLSDKIDYVVSKSSFKETWETMSHELTVMRSLYPHGWDNIRIYNNLAMCFCDYYKDIGLILKENENKELYFVVI